MVDAGVTEIVVSSWGGVWDRALRLAVSDPFRADTGIAVRHDRHVGLAIPEPVRRALHGERPPEVDVVWSNAVPALRAARAGLCDPLTEDLLPSLRYLHPSARFSELAGWPVVMAYVVPYVLVYRQPAFPERPPESWSVLLDERHRGKVAIYPDGNGIHPVAQILGGGELSGIPDRMEPCWSALQRLRPQVGSLDYSVGMERALSRGDLDLCFRALPNARGFRAAGAPVEWVAPREGVPDTADALWVPRFLAPARAAAAKAYLDFALSRSVYERWCDLLGVIPLRADVRPAEELRAAGNLPLSPDDRAGLMHVPDAVKLDHEEAWRRRFEAIFAGR